MTLVAEIERMLERQTHDWELAKKNYDALSHVRQRSFCFQDFEVKVQFNPARIVSTAAKTTATEIAKRPCFLCANHRPAEQEFISWRDYDILVNPFPVAPQHLTIAKKEHQPQAIAVSVEDMVALSALLPGYALFYNGPRCGASAPDHLHFQALPAEFLPLLQDYPRLKKADRVHEVKCCNAAKIYQVEHYLRSVLCVEAMTETDVVEAFREVYAQYEQQGEEPMMNVVCQYVEGTWNLFVFLRKLFRPWQYNAEEGKGRLLISPATVEMAGLLITPREEDFNALTEQDVFSIYHQIAMPDYHPPHIRVGVMQAKQIHFALEGDFRCEQTDQMVTGLQQCEYEGDKVKWKGNVYDVLRFVPQSSTDEFVLQHVKIGIDFHWEREETQRFKGQLVLKPMGQNLQVVNVVDVETYLESVISSEMSAHASVELLKAHAVISRSWLLHPILSVPATMMNEDVVADEWVRWYERDAHVGFDVCADDHCQRYQGTTRITRPEVYQAVKATRGQVLMFEGRVCDTRFSKSCGGVSECFENCWAPTQHPYLVPVRDDRKDEDLDLTQEEQAHKWICTRPKSFCDTSDAEVLRQVLNHYDRELPDAYRWKVVYGQQELSELIARKSGVDFGMIQRLIPIQRGPSGRIIRLRIEGEKRQLTIGKELEIRRWLAPTHLYSSAFVVERTTDGGFCLIGAGWGHGVGLCQIGAAVMAHEGFDYQQILQHYFPNTQLCALWEKRIEG